MKWIKIKDEKPEVDKDVICYSKLDGIFEGYLTNNVWFHKFKNRERIVFHKYSGGYIDYYGGGELGEQIHDVTHWMPLPKPPEND